MSPKQKKIAGQAAPKNKITGADFKAMREYENKSMLNRLSDAKEGVGMKQMLKKTKGNEKEPVATMYHGMGKKKKKGPKAVMYGGSMKKPKMAVMADKKKPKPLSKKEFQTNFKGRQYNPEEAWSHPPSKTGLSFGTGRNLDTSPGGDLAGPIIEGLKSGKLKSRNRLSDDIIGASKYQRKKKKNPKAVMYGGSMNASSMRKNKDEPVAAMPGYHMQKRDKY